MVSQIRSDRIRRSGDYLVRTHSVGAVPDPDGPHPRWRGMSMFAALRGPREILFGPGYRAAAAPVTAALGSRAFVCTDSRIAGDPRVKAVLRDLAGAGVDVDVDDTTEPELPAGQVAACVDRARRHRPDVVVGIGGGSCLDLAKVVATLLTHGGEPADYYGESRVPGPVLPVVAIPTTAGTGSEVTPVAVLGHPQRTTKVGVSSPYLIPAVAICDPELTATCPPELTAAAGADALAHAVEAYTAVRLSAGAHLARQRVFVGKNPLTDQLALRATNLVGQHLRRAVTDPDPQSRQGMMLAALTAGLAFGTAGTAAAHALQYPVGALTGTSHGLGVGVLLPYVMAFNRPERASELATLASALGGEPPAGGGRPADPPAERLPAERLPAERLVADLLAAVGLPRSLAALGMPVDKLEWAADEAMRAVRLVENNPRPLDRAGAGAILRAAYAGDYTGLDRPAPAPEGAT